MLLSVTESTLDTGFWVRAEGRAKPRDAHRREGFYFPYYKSLFLLSRTPWFQLPPLIEVLRIQQAIYVPKNKKDIRLMIFHGFIALIAGFSVCLFVVWMTHIGVWFEIISTEVGCYTTQSFKSTYLWIWTLFRTLFSMYVLSHTVTIYTRPKTLILQILKCNVDFNCFAIKLFSSWTNLQSVNLSLCILPRIRGILNCTIVSFQCFFYDFWIVQFSYWGPSKRNRNSCKYVWNK